MSVSRKAARYYTSPLLAFFPLMAAISSPYGLSYYVFPMFFPPMGPPFSLVWIVAAGLVGFFAPNDRNTKMYSMLVVFPLLAVALYVPILVTAWFLVAFTQGWFVLLAAASALLAGAIVLWLHLLRIKVVLAALGASIAFGMFGMFVFGTALLEDLEGYAEGYAFTVISIFLSVMFSAIVLPLVEKVRYPRWKATVAAIAVWDIVTVAGFSALILWSFNKWLSTWNP